MDRNSYLNPGNLTAKCNDAANLLRRDIDDCEKMRSNLKYVINDRTLQGEAIEAVKENLNLYFSIIDANISADQEDLKDLETLKGLLAGQEVLDGSFICDAYDAAQRNKNDADSKAAEARRDEANYRPSWYFVEGVGWVEGEYNNPYTGIAQHYEEIARNQAHIMDIFQRKKDAYDRIEASSAGLFSAGNEIRNTVHSKLTGIRENKKTSISIDIKPIVMPSV